VLQITWCRFSRLAVGEALHQQLRAVAVDGQAAGTFLAAMEQAVTVGALAVQVGQQGVAAGEGGAQRLIQSGHARGLEMGAGVYQEKRRHLAQCCSFKAPQR
jgi:hypothetical protein